MYLKSLELIGFKSFKEKTKLEFNEGITAVIGPNGSGKSNVSDAIRWVLGEQSAKNLRGSRMEDIIFAGTQNKKPLGLASVTITIDNSDNVLGIAFEEVKVNRKLYRSGESEFQINGVPCRLKDIHQLFMDTGIGREGYSIIGQGSIEQILSSKTEDRRHIFEEAAGIVKYKHRRDESYNKLEKEKQNLVRVKDIIIELEDKLPVLLERSEKAKKYLNLMEKLKLFKINIFLIEENKVVKEIEKVNKDYLNLESQLNEEELKNTNFKELSDSLKHKLNKINKNIDLYNEEITNIKLNIEQNESSTTLTFEQVKNLESNLNRINFEIQKKEKDISRNKVTIESLYSDIENLKDKVKDKNNSLHAKLNQLKTISESIYNSENEIKKYNANIIENITNINKVKSTINEITIANKRLLNRQEQLDIEVESIKNTIDKESINLQDLINCYKNIENSLLLYKEEVKTLTIEKVQAKESLDIITQQGIKITQSINDTKSRLNLLKELEENYEGYHKGVKFILKYKKNNPSKLKGIINIVGEVINVPKYLETAMEISFGNSIQNIITYTEEDAKKAISLLKSSKAGRATFLPISSVKKRNNEKDLKILSNKSVVGMAKDLITYNKDFENIILSLIGNIIIVDKIDSAIIISKENNYSHKIVTLEGELINPHGAITGGTSKNVSRILGRGNEIKELKIKLSLFEEEESKTNNKIFKLKEKLSNIDIKLQEAGNLTHEYELKSLTVKKNIEQKQITLEGLMEKKESYIIEINNINNELSLNRVNIRKLEDDSSSLEKNQSNISSNIIAHENNLNNLKDKKDIKVQEITEMKVEINTIEQQINFNKNNISDINTVILNLKEEINSHKLEVNNILDERSLKLKYIESLKLDTNKLKNLQIEKANEVDNIIEEKNTINLNIDNIQSNERDNLGLVSDLKSEFTRLKLKLESLKSKKEYLYNEIWEEYELTYQKALMYEKLEDSLEKMKVNEKKLKDEIKSLGNISLESLEEYKEVKDRCEFLVNQKSDIEEAIHKLKDIIIEFTQLMEDRFSSQFNIISKNFGRIFNEIFGGGTACLNLLNKENVLESGIEITAQPPGKKLQSMSLMSGGEKTLTAIALLFSILHMKPSPFCILDEIEAALDDANINKFAKYLGNFSSKTQFILITHKKGTMEIADNIYGVTMEEEGISKLLSISLK